ncbi:hypothetical protein N7467_000594 [Penicillium canescens]|nr:hypothetical protein N7467_000594 [Penicillium canescens]
MAETVWGDSALSMAVRSSQGAIANFLVDHGAILPCGTVRRSAFTPASCRGSNKLVEHFTVDYEAIAGKTMHRRSSRDMKRLPGLLQETPGSMPGSQAEAQGNDEISYAEFIEQYNFKTNFSQKYILKQQLGTGHSSEVFACFNKVTSVLFAVKIISSNETLKSSRLSQALKNEFQVLRELQKRPHPNLLGMVDLFAEYEQNRICVVQDLAPDGELFNLIVTKQKLTKIETRTISTQLFSAVGFLHDQGWVHRDIKPENILVVDEKSLAIKLGDFGLATRLRKETGFEEPATTLCGTPSYMAPEVLQTSSKRRYGYPVDVWSCGVALYICLAGFPPFSDELRTEKNPFDLVQQIKIGHFDYPSPYWDSIGDLALNLIDQMLCVDLRNRLTIRECTSHPWMLNESSSSSIPANETSLYLAASDGAIDKMRRQLIEGAAVMAADNRGWTPLAIASSRGHTDTVKLLLEKGADKMVQTKTLLTPLHLACYRGRVEVTRLLLESGANWEAKSENGSTPLLFALKMGHLEVTRMLLEKGVDVTVADDKGWTPLAVASSTGHVEAVELLLENGADMMVRCEALLTPLHLACHYGRVEVVKLLLENGADAAAIEAGGCTPLHYVSEGDIFEDAHIQASQLLLRHPGVSIEAQDNNLRTPLYLAATRGHIKAVRLYLEQGAAVYVKDRYRSTPLAAAVRNGHGRCS